MKTNPSSLFRWLRRLLDLFAVLSVGLASRAQDSQAVLVDAAYSTALTVDGNAADWARLSSGVVTMDTQGRGTNGIIAVNVRYAWDYTNLYVLVQEKASGPLSTHAQEGPDAEAYQNTFYLFDCIAFWLDLDNNAGTSVDGSVIVENNADFQPWFGFSSAGRTDLIYGRANDSGNLNLDGLANVRVATGGSFAAHNRTIEVAIAWADIAAAVDPARQPGGNLLTAITPGYTFGSEPLLINNDYNGQAFIGPAQYEPPSGTDTDSRDIRLVSSAEVVDAAYSTALTVDGNAADWANLSSGVVSMDTQGRGTNGILAVNIRYAWDTTNVYLLVQENPNHTISTHAQEGPDGATYQNTFYLFDCIAFWLDLDNNAGTSVEGSVIVENNADFQPWFGFSSAGRTDLIYGRANDSGSLNLDGLANVKVGTGGSFAAHNRTIEVAIAWADIAAAVDPARQPGGNLLTAITPGYTFGSEPLLINNDYNGQAFIGPAQYEPPSGTDSDSRDIRLVATVVAPVLTIQSIGNTVIVQWPAAAAGYVLESVTTLTVNGSWSAVTVEPTFNPGTGMNQVILPAAGQTAFYRLRN